MAHIRIEIELADSARGRRWQGGVYSSSRSHMIEVADTKAMLAEVKAAIAELTAPPVQQPAPEPAPPVPERVPQIGEPTPRLPRGQRRTNPEPFFTDPGGSTESLRR
jgi:hypothetical protein